jgi:hypothetical protein
LMSDIDECSTGLNNCFGSQCHNLSGTFECGTEPVIAKNLEPGKMSITSLNIIL